MCFWNLCQASADQIGLNTLLLLINKINLTTIIDIVSIKFVGKQYGKGKKYEHMETFFDVKSQIRMFFS